MEHLKWILEWLESSTPRWVRSIAFLFLTYVVAEQAWREGVMEINPFLASIYTLMAEWFFKDDKNKEALPKGGNTDG